MTESAGQTDSAKHVVVVGGGFAGLHCARKLAAADPEVRITLIDKNNYQQFQPLLYQVATALLSPSNIAFNLRSVLMNHPRVDIKLGEVVSVDLNSHTVHTSHGHQYQGDFLVLAAGAQANFFGTPGAVEHTFPLYSLHDAELLRSRILAMLEAADANHALIDKGALNFVIVGAGPTGTEMAGAFADILESWKMRETVHKAYKDLPLDRAQVFLVDAGHAVLGAFSTSSQSYAARMLTQRGVQIRLRTTVTEVGSEHVTLSDGTRIPTHTVIWAGGLQASSVSKSLGIKLGHGGRIDVQPDLTVPGQTGVYALGDFANIAGKDGRPLPQLASVAEQSGKWCAQNIVRDLEGKPRKQFQYLDKGIMAMIGRNAAVAEVGEHRHELQGAIAFAAWLGVHAALLTSTLAKVEAFIEWAWWYFGGTRDDIVLDRTEELNVDWNQDTEAMASVAPSQSAGKAG